MNKARRAEIDRILADLEELKSRVESVESDEREYYDNMPEGFRNGDKGQAAEAAADLLAEAVSSIEDAADKISEATQ